MSHLSFSNEIWKHLFSVPSLLHYQPAWFIIIKLARFTDYLSSVGTATGYELNDWGSIIGKVKLLFFNRLHPHRLWGQPRFHSQCAQFVKWQGREDGHPLPSYVEVSNGGAIPSLHHVFMTQRLIKHKDNIAFMIYRLWSPSLCIGDPDVICTRHRNI
jgi:hypothetical protein